MKQLRSSIASAKGVALAATAILFISLLGFLLWEAKSLNFFIILFLSNPGACLLFAAGVALTGLCAWSIFLKEEAPTWRPSAAEKRKSFLAGASAWTFGGLALLATVAWVASLTLNGYLSSKGLMESVTVTKDVKGFTYDERAAYPVALAQAKQAVTDQGTELGETDYIPAQGRYTSLVSKRGWLSGFSEVISQKVALTGQATSEHCSFSPEASDRFGAWFNNNMWRNATKAAGYGAIFEEVDSYGYCQENGVPMVILPFTRYDGFFPAIRKAGGVVIYDGKTGQYSVKTSVAPGELPGPVYPASLSAEARDSTVAMSSFLDYVFSRVGFEDTSDDEGDPNGDNRSEFNLQRKEMKEADWVTPLTLRGASTSIAGLSFVGSTSLQEGTLNPMTVKVFEEQRAANSAVLDRLKSDYNRDNLNWADSNLKIWEITPLNDKEWVASVGYAKNIIARVRMKADLSSCLEDGAGKLIRCSSDTPGTSPAPPAETPGTSVDPGKVLKNSEDLKMLTPQELASLQDAVTKEMLRRVEAAKK